MAMYSISLDVSSALAVPRHCPSCGSEMVVARGEDVTFVCRSCRRRWRQEMGTLVALGLGPAPVPEVDPPCGDTVLGDSEGAQS